jgi:hypothetical protein
MNPPESTMNATSRPDKRRESRQTPALVTPVSGSDRAGDDQGKTDWLDALLTEDAGPPSASTDDPVFVAQVMGRLAAEPSASGCNEGFSVTRWSHRLLLGFVALVVTALCLAAPSALQAWLQIARQPWSVSTWYQPDLWGFMAGVAMLVFGGLELVRTIEEIEVDRAPGGF